MDCVNSFVFILFCFGLLSSFIALITTGWIVYVEDSGIVQYSGLYQSCTIEKCTIDWDKRPIYGQVVLFLMAASAAVMLLGIVLLAFAELKSKKVLLKFSGSFGIIGGLSAGACAALYSTRSVNDLQVAAAVGNPSYYYSYGLAWTAMCLCIASSVIVLYKGCKATRTTVQRL